MNSSLDELHSKVVIIMENVYYQIQGSALSAWYIHPNLILTKTWKVDAIVFSIFQMEKLRPGEAKQLAHGRAGIWAQTVWL